jgi:hypothetical protein
LLLEAGYSRKSVHAGASLASSGCKRLGELRGIYVTVTWVPQGTLQVMKLNERMACADFRGTQQLVVETVGSRHAQNVSVFIHSLGRMGKSDGSSDVIVDWIADLIS